MSPLLNSDVHWECSFWSFWSRPFRVHFICVFQIINQQMLQSVDSFNSKKVSKRQIVWLRIIWGSFSRSLYCFQCRPRCAWNCSSWAKSGSVWLLVNLKTNSTLSCRPSVLFVSFRQVFSSSLNPCFLNQYSRLIDKTNVKTIRISFRWNPKIWTI